MTEPAPSLSISSQRTLPACVSVSHTAPSPPPVSSSTVTTTSSSPRAGRQPSRASETAATTSAAVWDFMSTAPRPQTKPSTTSLDLEAGAGEQAREILLRRALVAGRVDGVAADQPLQDAGRLLLQVGHAYP